MKLALLLYILNLKLRRAAKKNPELKKKLKQRNYTVVIRTADRRRGRFFTFIDGAIISKRGMHPRPDVELVWVDAATAFRVLAAGDDKAVVQAMGKSQLKIEGNLDHFFWFGDVLKLMMNA